MTRRLFLALFASVPVAGALAQPAVLVEEAWTRAAGQGATGAGYMTLRSGAGDRLLGATSPLAQRVELHTHLRDGDVMRMRPVESVEVQPGTAVTLRPGGLHLMLYGLARPLSPGEQVPITLRFERAGEVPAQLHVQAAGARGPGGHGRH
ncbi:copper chaperone PCu(A)C [Sabulicella glaciei]|uniref:Copper chaperone PCu(A)C n=1 Tax=Sabulicella glaciei TaxID=2984948 RepID=A0ABT3NYB4_9PROT|nr:copper chaperone PCu(A)C [Roseococcus sp. MDT2-1-1]MCW8087118.1 copper chaperone PCu(A)C [Roseococcus sp. MDT2-1-1]